MTTTSKTTRSIEPDVLQAIEEMEDKYSQLVWYARKAPASDEEYWGRVPKEIREGALNAAAQVAEHFPDEIDLLKNPSTGDWQHGFHSGMLAALRFCLTATYEEMIEFDGEPPMMMGGLEDATELFPELDT